MAEIEPDGTYVVDGKTIPFPSQPKPNRAAELLEKIQAWRDDDYAGVEAASELLTDIEFYLKGESKI